MKQRRTRPRSEIAQRASAPVSGAVGGPATGHGIKYQLDYAVRQALELISRALSSPHIPWIVWMEPRVIDGNTTNWDIGIAPPIAFIEAKLNPTKQDIFGWFEQVRQKASGDANVHFHFVYSRGGGQGLLLLQQLIRNATESSGDRNRFNSQIHSEGMRGHEEILATLGPEPQATLARMKILNVPESVLASDLQLFARQLAGESGGARLIDYLFHRFAEGVPDRRQFGIHDLVKEILAAGIQLHACPNVSCDDLASNVLGALVILQASPAGVPIGVLAEACASNDEELEVALVPLLGRIVSVENGIYSVRPLSSSFTRPDRADLLGRALKSILRFIEARKDPTGKGQVRNAVALAEVCAGPRPEITATVFRALDKDLKNIGDKHLVLKIAELSIRAAREAAARTREVAEGEAHALICGRSWVFQRTKRLADARVAAEESLSCGKDINWERNTAYCMKCLGRLLRLEAEQTPMGVKRKELLEQSTIHLREAIGRFSAMAEFGPDHPEVGDCYSLLGRTFLYERKMEEAEHAVRRATELISDQTSKDYLDLVLLDGDLQAARGDRRSAEAYYDEALGLNTHPNPEISEMRARAHFKRGLNFAATGQKGPAKLDFRKAATLWKELGEMEACAEAEWSEILVDGRVSPELERRLEGEVHWVRVKVITTHEGRVQERRKIRWARREEPGTSYWEHLIKMAKERFRIEVPSW